MSYDEITSGARTVTTLAQHLEELQAEAGGLIGQLGVTDKGYFTPTAEDHISHLLVSYWQSRNALFEVVEQFREKVDYDSDETDEFQLSVFLIGYAAAVLLVDAGRFLREAFDDNEPVRNKLNQGDPNFDIPPDVYNTVQESLTSVTNAYHMYNATEFFDSHRGDLNAIAQKNEQLQPVLAIIDRLGDRVRVSPTRFAKAKLQVEADVLKQVVVSKGLGRAVYWVQEIVSRMMAHVYTVPGHQPGLPGDVIEQLYAHVQPGDVFVVRKEHAATNYFLPGFWPHAALYIGEGKSLEELGLAAHENWKDRWGRLLDVDGDEPRRVLEAMADGVWIRSVQSPLKSDAIAVVRPMLSDGDLVTALGRGMFHEGKQYDFDFDFTRSDKLVCSEVIYRTYEGVGGIEFNLTSRAGRLTLASEDILDLAIDRRGFEPVAVFAPTHGEGMAVGAGAEALLKKTMRR